MQKVHLRHSRHISFLFSLFSDLNSFDNTAPVLLYIVKNVPRFWEWVRLFQSLLEATKQLGVGYRKIPKISPSLL